MDTVVMPATADAAATAVADVREERERVSKYLTRLKEVRHKRSAMEVHTADILPLAATVTMSKGCGERIVKR